MPTATAVMKEYVVKTMGFEEHNIIYVEDAALSKLNEILLWNRRRAAGEAV